MRTPSSVPSTAVAAGILSRHLRNSARKSVPAPPVIEYSSGATVRPMSERSPSPEIVTVPSASRTTDVIRYIVPSGTQMYLSGASSDSAGAPQLMQSRSSPAPSNSFVYTRDVRSHITPILQNFSS